MSTYEYYMNAYRKKYLAKHNYDLKSYERDMKTYRSSIVPEVDYKKWSVPNPKVEYISGLVQASTSHKNSYLNIDNKRSNLDRAFDALQVGQYTVMGGLLGAVSDELTVWEGMTQGLRAGNPLGDGRDKWEYSFSDVLGSMGWEPESGGGKVAKFAVGLAGDIFLDPLTYISGGVLAGIKGSGQATAKLATKGNKIVDLLGDASKFIDNIDDIKDVTHMTQEMAEALVKNSQVVKTGYVGVDIASDAKRLAEKYNKLLGVETSADVVWSLGNAPLGKKIFGSLADKQFRLFSDAGIRAVSDKTIAPVYAQIRNKVIGGKIGKLFSPNHQLYKLAGTHPESVYNHIKILDSMTKGNLNKIDEMKKINTYATQMMGLTPKEVEDVMTVMQDKNVWHSIEKSMKFIDTKEAQSYKDKIIKMKQSSEETVQKWIKEPPEYRAKAIEQAGVLKKKEEILDEVYSQINKELQEFDMSNLRTAEDMGAYIKQLEAVRTYVDTKTVKFDFDMVENLNKQWDDFKTGNRANLDARKLTKPEIEAGKKKVVKDLRDQINKDNFTSNSTYTKARKDVVEKGYVEYKRASKFSDAMEQSLGEGWTKVVQTDGSIRYHPPKEIKQAVAGVTPRNYNDYQLEKQKFVDELNVSIFGDKGYIAGTVWEGDLDKLMRYMKTHDKEDTIAYILHNKDMYSGKTPLIYKYIGETIGYGDRSVYKSWKQYYNGQMKEVIERNIDSVTDEFHKGKLLERLKEPTYKPTSEDIYKLTQEYDLPPLDKKKLIDLQKDDVQRKFMQEMFNKAETMDEVERMIKSIETKEVEQFDFAMNEAWNEHRAFYTMDDAKSGKVDIDFKLTDTERDIARKYFLDIDEGMRAHGAFKGAKNSDDASIKVMYESYANSQDEVIKYSNILANKNTQITKLKGMVGKTPKDNEATRKMLETINKLSTEVKNIEVRLADEVARSKGYYDEVMNAVSLKAGVPSDATLKYYDEVIDEFEKILHEKKLMFGELEVAPRAGYIKDSSFDRATLFTEAQIRVNKSKNSVEFKDYQKLLDAEGKARIASKKERLQKAVERIDGRSVEEIRRAEHDKMVAQLVEDLKARKEAKFAEFVDDLKEINPKIQYDVPKPKSAVKKAVDKPEAYKGYPMNLYELDANKEYIETFIKRSDELLEGFNRSYDVSKVVEDPGVVDKIKKAKSELALHEETLAKRRGKLVEDLNLKANQLEEETIEISRRVKNLLQNADSITPEYMADEIAKIRQYEIALSNNEGFINFLYANKGKAGSKFDMITRSELDELMKSYNPNAGEYILDPDLDLTDRARDIADSMRKKFQDMGVSEVSINKLFEGQYDANAFDYLPHIITDEGKALFKDPEIIKKMQGFGNVQGFGTEFNNFAQSRTLKIPDEFGGMIDKPTIEQINKFFSPFTGGKPVFSTDLSEIYVARAQKHVDLMYDEMYMENMVELFGKEYTGEVLENHGLTVNYGHLKKNMLDMVSKDVEMDIGDEIGRYINRKDVKNKIQAETAKIMSRKNNKLTYEDAMDEVYEKFIKDYREANFPSDVRTILREKKLAEFATDSGTYDMLNDKSMPLLEFTDDHIKGVGDIKQRLTDRFEEKIRRQYTNLLDKPGSLKRHITPGVADEVANMSIGDIAKDYRRMMEFATNSEYKRLERQLKVIESMNLMDDLKVGQLPLATMDNMNQSRKLQIQKDNNAVLGVYDKFLHFIKVNQTAVMPAFHMRNKFANDFNNYLAVGADAYDIKLQTDILDAMRFRAGKAGVVDKAIDITSKDGKKSKILLSELLDMAEAHGVTQKGVFAIDLGTELESGGLFSKLLPGRLDPTDMQNFAVYKKGTELGSMVENHDRLTHFIALVRRGEDYASAAESSKKFLFDYSDLTMFEASVMKRVLPYYTWLRKNGPLQLEQMLKQPEKYRNIAKVLGGVRGMVPYEERINKAFVNDFALDWVQTPFTATNPHGNEEPVLWNPNMPFMDISRLPDLSDPLGYAKDLFTQASPILKTPIELATNRNYFFDSPIAREGESRLQKSIGHVASQMAVVPAVEGLIKKEGADKALHALNATSGVKFLSYDYNTFKAMKIQEILANGNKKRPNIVGDVAKSITKGFKDSISYAVAEVDNEIGRMVEGVKPQGADEYMGALRPISQASFDELSPDEQAKYIPPTREDGAYIHQRAQELADQAYQDSGLVKKFVWALLDGSKWDKEAEDYRMAKVSYVNDGDTFMADFGNGKKESVRILLVDTPETEKEGQEAMPFGEEALQHGIDALFDKDVKIYMDGKDKYNRTLAFVEVDGQDYGESVLEEGMGQYRFDFDKNYPQKSSYLDAESRASTSGKGVFSIPGYATPGIDDDYNMNVDVTGYNEFKKKKYGEILNKKDTVNTNPSGWDNVLRLLK